MESSAERKYAMLIAPQTVEQLGVKLYDRVAAVLAELISNSYDADAEKVFIRAPMGKWLAEKHGGKTLDAGHTIEVEDDGCGMGPDGLSEYFLVVGVDRRADTRRGDVSPKFNRKVMGRKGVGKLAPFGICSIIEVESAGGPKTENGYEVGHIILNYKDIRDQNSDQGTPYRPEKGSRDGTYSKTTYTKITLRDFARKRVPDIESLSRQLAQRFGLSQDHWRVSLYNNAELPMSGGLDVGSFDTDFDESTKIEFDPGKNHVLAGSNEVDTIKPGFELSGQFYPISGFIAYSKYPFKDDLMAGIRIYCRGKIAAQSAVFNMRAGFTGEYDVRSYLIGELHADWLDSEEDLIQTDRNNILWSSELGSEFEKWGQSVVKYIGKLTREPQRIKAQVEFFETSDAESKIDAAYPFENEEVVRNQAKELAKTLGRAMKFEEASDQETADTYIQLAIDFAPYVTLEDLLRRASDTESAPFQMLPEIMQRAKLAELASFGRIAKQRIDVVQRLEALKDDPDTPENDLQKLVEEAPWLINPHWTPITQNQSLQTLKRKFEREYEKKTGKQLSLSDIDHPNKRPDFALTSQDGVVQIVEIKRPDHALTDDEFDRVVIYQEIVEQILNDPANPEIRSSYSEYQVTLVCDKLRLTGAQARSMSNDPKISHINWDTFFTRAQNAHNDFLIEYRRQRQRQPRA